MAEDTTKASFAIELQDDVSAGALSASDALAKLQAQMTADTKALSEMQRAMRNLKQATTSDVTQPMKELTDRLAAVKERVASSQGAFVALGGKFGDAKKSGGGFATKLAEMQLAIRAMGGPAANLNGELAQLAGRFKGATGGALAMTAAVLATATAVGVLSKKLFEEGLAAGNARRNEQLHIEALGMMRHWYGILPVNVKETQEAIDRVSASVSISREKVSGYADQLIKAGVRGTNFGLALEGAAIKASALGDAAGSGFADFSAQLVLGGVGVKKYAQDVKNRFGGIVQRQMSSLEVQQLKQKENWASMFRGLNVEPVLDAMKRFRDILNINTAAGTSLKLLLGDLLKPLFGAVEGGLVFMRRFFKQMLIGVNEIKLAYKEIRNWFALTFGKSQTVAAQSLLDRFEVGKYVVYALAAGFASLAYGVVAATWPFLLGAVAVYELFDKMELLIELWEQTDWTALGTNVWQSIVKGVKSGWDAVTRTFSELGDKAIKAFKRVMKIQSPSRIMVELGYQLPAGVAKGIIVGTPQAQAAAANMVEVAALDAKRRPVLLATQATAPRLGRDTQRPVTATAGTSRNTTNNSANQAITVTISQLHIHGEGSNTKEAAHGFKRALEKTLEGVKLQMGAPMSSIAPPRALIGGAG